MSEEKTTYIVAGDIGGTNSRFALHTPGASEPLLVHVYSNEEALGGKGSDDGGQDDPKSYHHATLRPFFEKALAEVEAFAHMDDEAFVERVQIVACLATAGPGECFGLSKTSPKPGRSVTFGPSFRFRKFGSLTQSPTLL